MSQAARRPRRWIWYFVGLAALTVVSITVQIWYNRQQLLTPERLAAARKLWIQNGPKSYDLAYTTKRPDSSDSFEVQVRQGKVTSVTCNGRQEEERLWHFSGMDALFGFIEKFQEEDAAGVKAGRPRVYASAAFDSTDGHLLRYVRSVMSTRERVEINITSLEKR